MTPNDAGQTLDELARLVAEGRGVTETAESVIALARLDLACDYAGITVRDRHGSYHSLAVTDPVVERADQLQYELGEGPCVLALDEQREIVTEDLSSDPRWPRWGSRAAELGLSSVLAVNLTDDGKRMGVLNLYSTQRRTFTVEDIAFGHVFGARAAVALSNSHRIEQFHAAIDGRTVIGQAQGILMERYQLNADEAFAVLRRLSQERNVRLRHVATSLVSPRSLDESFSEAVHER